MADAESPQDLERVRRAIELGGQGVGGCCEWNGKAASRIRERAPLPGLTPEGIKQLLCDFVAAGGEIVQVREQRPEYQDRRFYYKAVVPVPELKHGLFVEVVLVDDEPEYPTVQIVNAHEQVR